MKNKISKKIIPNEIRIKLSLKVEAYSKDLLEIMSNDQLMIYVHEEVHTPKKGDSCCKSK